MKEIITKNSKETQELGEDLAKELKGGPASTRENRLSTRGGDIVCLSGDLGSGKTTFTQGLLKGLGAKGPYTSPTFLIMKHYHITRNTKHVTKNRKLFHDVYHIDAYRVNPKNILDLGWEEIINNPQNIVIIEWAERIREIIPARAIWIEFEWKGENERKIKFEF